MAVMQTSANEHRAHRKVFTFSLRSNQLSGAPARVVLSAGFGSGTRHALRQLAAPRRRHLLGVLAASLTLVPLASREQQPAHRNSAPAAPVLASPGSADQLHFTPEELRELQRRFGVHGPQPRLAQLFTEGIDQFQPLRNHTLQRLEDLRPVILQECERQHVNPVFVTAVLFDEMRHAKPGEGFPVAAQSGLFKTHGPGQVAVSELMHQGLVPRDATAEQVAAARIQLLDPSTNVRVLVGKFARLSRELGLPSGRVLQASRSASDAKALATLAYLHNGKLDYPRRILRSMQDPALHALLFSERKTALPALI